MEWIVRDTVEKAEQDEIYQGLHAYNQARRVGQGPRDLGIFAVDDAGEKQGGLIGETVDNWLLIKYRWVREGCRGRGLGSEMLRRAEAEAKERGCKYAFVDTFDFQAPDFYPRYGYETRFVLEEYPLTGKRHYFTKTL